MAIELRILTGARAGQSQTFQKSTITIGRHPDCDLRFDATRDLDVSTKHAEIRAANDAYTLVDAQSTNGTFVNGKRLPRGEERVLANDDVIGFGARGPNISVRMGADVVPVRLPTTERVAVAVRQQTRGLRVGVLGLVILLAVASAAGVWYQHQAAIERDASRQRLRKVFAKQAQQREEIERRSLNEPDWVTMRQGIDPAVVLISTQIGGRKYEASGFCIGASGTILTSRHVVADKKGRATRIVAKFANTRDWRSAHIVRLPSDSTLDLALLQLDDAGTYPNVKLLADVVDIPAGGTIATIGFPLGTDIPMTGPTNDLVVKTTLSVGTVSKTPTRDLLQIDAFASHGSSGSPVLDGHGHVIGVVYGGPKASAGRIVFAVPAERVKEFLTSVK
jgi:Trypsin-like serine proteases, typically periplasmic, contain C-terminal PDZ domain